MSDLEIWKKWVLEGVEVHVSSFGGVIGSYGKRIKSHLNSNHLFVTITKDKRRHSVSLARLVGEAFIGEIDPVDSYTFSSEVSIRNIGTKPIVESVQVVGKKRRGLGLVAGFGVNDVKMPTKINGVKNIPYQTWLSMIHRCYGVNKEKCYASVSVCKDWSKFSNFLDDYQYMVGSYQKGFVLDKDILCSGEKIYSKENCVLIPKKLNSIFATWKRELIVKEDGGGFTTWGLQSRRKQNRVIFSTKTEVEDYILRYRKERVIDARNEFCGVVDFRVIDVLEKIIKDENSFLL